VVCWLTNKFHYLQKFGKIRVYVRLICHVNIMYVVVCIQKKDYMLRLLRLVDKANGYMFGELEERDVQALIKEKLEIDD
jgi:hypothetical protein